MGYPSRAGIHTRVCARLRLQGKDRILCFVDTPESVRYAFEFTQGINFRAEVQDIVLKWGAAVLRPYAMVGSGERTNSRDG